MSMTIILLLALGIYISYKLGMISQRKIYGDIAFSDALNRAKFPACVAEEIQGQYYLYEKDTNNFLCQAETLHDLPKKLFENKKISLAIILCPQVSREHPFYCINGKLYEL